MVTVRRFAALMAGLFIIAQVFGVFPLISGHTTHVAEIERLAAKQLDANAAGTHGKHHPGDADGFVQHHELQDLSGTAACAVCFCATDFVQAAIIADVSPALTAADPVLLERPPKQLLSI